MAHKKRKKNIVWIQLKVFGGELRHPVRTTERALEKSRKRTYRKRKLKRKGVI